MKVLNATELFTWKWLILCYVNFTSIEKKSMVLKSGILWGDRIYTGSQRMATLRNGLYMKLAVWIQINKENHEEQQVLVKANNAHENNKVRKGLAHLRMSKKSGWPESKGNCSLKWNQTGSQSQSLYAFWCCFCFLWFLFLALMDMENRHDLITF